MKWQVELTLTLTLTQHKYKARQSGVVAKNRMAALAPKLGVSCLKVE